MRHDFPDPALPIDKTLIRNGARPLGGSVVEADGAAFLDDEDGAEAFMVAALALGCFRRLLFFLVLPASGGFFGASPLGAAGRRSNGYNLDQSAGRIPVPHGTTTNRRGQTSSGQELFPPNGAGK
jgi:hypothetical protein